MKQMELEGTEGLARRKGTEGPPRTEGTYQEQKDQKDQMD